MIIVQQPSRSMLVRTMGGSIFPVRPWDAGPISDNQLTVAGPRTTTRNIRGSRATLALPSLLVSQRFFHTATMAFLMPVSRRLSTRLAAPAPICRQCLQNRPAVQLQSRSLVLDALRQSRAAAAPTARFQSARTKVAQQVRAASGGAKTTAETVAGDGARAYAEAVENAPTRKRLPEFTSSKAVGLWLLGSAVSVFGIIIFGGLTRLTESG